MAQPFKRRQTQEELEEAERIKAAQFRPNLAVRLVCPDCKNVDQPNIVEEYSSGDLVCGDCGYVLGDRIVDTRSEWRTFADSEGGADPNRVGGPTSALDGADQYETAVSFKDNNTGLSKELARAQMRVNSTAKAARGGGPSKNLAQASMTIDQMCNQISLGRHVSETAKQLFKRVDDERICRGRATVPIAAACIFISCRMNGVERTFKEMAKLSGASKKDIATVFNTIKLTLDTGTPGGDGRAPPEANGTVQHPAYGAIVRMCAHLALPAYVQSAAQKIVKRVTDEGLLTGRTPQTVAGAVLFFTCHLLNEPKTMSEIAGIAEMSEGTVRLAYKLLYPAREKLVAGEKLTDAGGRGNLSRLPAA